MGAEVTKAEFSAEFRRLVLCGYRLPADTTADELMREWFETFKDCHADELATAITTLKRTKPDTFWPAIGVLYQDIQQQRAACWRERPAFEYPPVSDARWKEHAKFWRELGTKLGLKKLPGDQDPS